jgi:hypothetical protein
MSVSFERVFHQWKITVMGVDEDESNKIDTPEQFADLDVEVSWDF